MISYDVSPAKLPTGFHRSATYDDALAALSFTISGRMDAANLTLQALARLVRPDGSLWFSYSTANSWPDESEHDSALVRAGSIGWAGYAFTFYLAHAPPCAAQDAGCARERTSFLATAVRLGNYLLSLESTRPEHLCYGLLRQGYGSIRLSYRPDARDVIEEYLDSPALGFSTENNISSWFFLRALLQLTGEPRWKDAADRIRRGLLRVEWDERISQFDEGFSPGGQRDSVKALDCASWGALFLIAAGEADKAQTALRSMETYASRDGDAAGYRPYFDEPIYPSFEIGKFYFPGEPRKQWRDLPLVWSEGTLGVALAYLRMGQPDRARKIVQALQPLQVASNGLRYASREMPHQMSDSPSVAASSWLVFVAEAMKGNARAEQFWK
ncbi:MAG: hypothetical protein DMG57_33175 [Acidobacteria bacterium]|nr:MAG: hypothetical protein DMG57_33175 [Acidobacteriota bacterium]